MTDREREIASSGAYDAALGFGGFGAFALAALAGFALVEITDGKPFGAGSAFCIGFLTVAVIALGGLATAYFRLGKKLSTPNDGLCKNCRERKN